MDLLRLDGPLPDDLHEPVLVIALDGWTDAGAGGSRAAELLVEQLGATPLGDFDPDRLFDYRDRRPALHIDRGELGELEWPDVTLRWLRPASGPDLLLVAGGEPDLSWRGFSSDLVELARSVGATRSVGLGSVPGPVPHTRPSRLVVTSTDDEVLDRFGRPHEQVLVPASCQVMLEHQLGEAGLAATGFWARIPHYVATTYPEASRLLLTTVAQHLGLDLDPAVLDDEVEDQRGKLDVAATGSPEVEAHIKMLEEGYDEDAAGGITGPLPTGDQIAAELERFLRDESA